jgi:hypothetical protein
MAIAAFFKQEVFRHQLNVLRRQCPGRPRLSPIDRLLWVWLYRLWPRCLDAMRKPAVIGAVRLAHTLRLMVH